MIKWIYKRGLLKIKYSTNIEEKSAREFNRNIDKQKNNNKFDENRNTKKKTSRKNQNEAISEKKLNNLKQRNNLHI